MLEVVQAEIPDVCSLNAEVDPELSRILKKMIAKDPAERYQSCHELVRGSAAHPLVAKGGPITLQTKMSPAAATMIGQKTPVSGQQQLPGTSPTPLPLPTMATPTPSASTAARTQPDLATPVHQSAFDNAAAPARSPVLPIAIAAALLLALVGGAWAFRDRIPMLQQFAPARSADQSAMPATLTAATDTGAAGTPGTPAAAAAPTAAATATGANGASVADLAGSGSKSGAGAASADHAAVASTAAANSGGAPANDANAGPAPRASQVEPLRDLPAAQAARATPRVARATRPPPVSAPPRPHIPTIAVVAGGDPAVSAPIEQAIEQALSHKGFHLLDEAMMPRVERMLHGPRADIAGLLDLLDRHRGSVDAVVVVHVRPVGEQQITFYGQSDTLKTAQLDITAYAVDGRHKLGSGWSDNVNFTAMSARDKAREAVEPMLEEIAERLDAYRPSGRKG